MKVILSTLFTLVLAVFGFAQTKNNSWSASSSSANTVNSRIVTSTSQTYNLDLNSLQENLSMARSRELTDQRTNHIISFPTADGKVEAFRVVEASVMHPDLAAKYPGIKSYAGQGIDDPSATIRFSLSDQAGFHGMILSGTKGISYIDPINKNKNNYRVYARKNIDNLVTKFQCLTDEEVNLPSLGNNGSYNMAQATDDKKLRKYRLAMSCTAEYGNIFAGSGTNAQKVANILAQMNITMTRVNGVYERDLAITMEIIANNDAIIYYGSTNSDPWTNEYNNKTQQTIDGIIGDNNYDIGHNFNTTGGGSAGCIGCVCTSGSKGSGYTGRANPTGDPFDIDYVAHEIGHQFGGYHTQSNSSCRSGSGATEVEPGSGSSIMAYAGICAANVQNNSDAYFNYVNIRDISANIQTGISSSCAQVINLSNNAPTANAGADYSIPRSTAFILRGQGSDPDGDAITYTWEQNDPENPNSNSAPSSTRTSGPLFRSLEGTTSPDRYMPRISDVVSGNLTPTWEVVPSVARNMEFALTVRDNKAGGGQTDDDLMRVTTVNVTPFTVSAPNTAVTWNVGQTQSVSWNVGATAASPINCSNVNILLSIDGGFTYPITLLANTANDGSANITAPNNVSTACRIMVAAADNIFYDISNTNFSIEGAVACNATTPSGLSATNIGSSTASLNWNAVSGASYGVRYRATGSSTWTTTSVSGTTTSINSLSALTQYEAQVRSVCTSTNSSYSSSTQFTTTEVQLNYCASNGNSTSDEYISRVQFGSIDNTTNAGAGGYSDQTSLSSNLTIGDATAITITPTWTGTIYDEGYAVWVDFNKNGSFDDAGEQVYSAAASKNTSVSGSFTAPSSAQLGSTRMRVSMKYNGIPTSCESFNYGEVEDYSVNIVGASSDTQAPSIPSGLSVSGTTETQTTLSWIASSDNVGVSEYDIFVDGALDGSTSGTTYVVNGLSAVTSYSLTVSAKDAAGNSSAVSSSVNVTTSDLTPPSAPGGLAANNTTQTTTDLSWNPSTDNIGVTSYTVSVNGTSDGSISNTSYSLSGLSPSTNYAITVVAFDAAGNQSSSSNVSITTLDPVAGGCTNGITSFPYNEGFESGLGAWTQDTGDNIDWTVDASGTPSSNTGPSSANEGSNYLYIESSGNGTGYPNKVAIIESPCFDLSSETTATFAFDYHMYGSSIGTLDLQASTDGNTWSSIWSLSGDQGNTWSTQSVDLIGYTGGTVSLRFVGTTSTSYRSDMAIDKLSLSAGAVAGCSDVTLSLTVDNYPEETGWTITDGTGALVSSQSYTNATPDNATVIETSCLDDGCYTFTITDAYGDGICCSYGNGSYTLEDENGTLLASGGSFASSQSTNFCINTSANRNQVAVQRFVPSTLPTIYPNPAVNVIYINTPADIVSVRILSVSGVLMMEVGTSEHGIDVSELASGVYVMSMITEKATLNSSFIKK